MSEMNLEYNVYVLENNRQLLVLPTLCVAVPLGLCDSIKTQRYIDREFHSVTPKKSYGR